MDIFCFDAAQGFVQSNLKNGKELYILVKEEKNNIAQVKVPSTNGVYNIETTKIQNVFKETSQILNYKENE